MLENVDPKLLITAVSGLIVFIGLLFGLIYFLIKVIFKGFMKSVIDISNSVEKVSLSVEKLQKYDKEKEILILGNKNKIEVIKKVQDNLFRGVEDNKTTLRLHLEKTDNLLKEVDKRFDKNEKNILKVMENLNSIKCDLLTRIEPVL